MQKKNKHDSDWICHCYISVLLQVDDCTPKWLKRKWLFQKHKNILNTCCKCKFTIKAISA